MRKFARRHHAVAHEALDESVWLAYSPGQHVVTVDGPGVVTEALAGPFGAEYTIELDDGLGGGRYDERHILGVEDGSISTVGYNYGPRRYNPPADELYTCRACGHTHWEYGDDEEYHFACDCTNCECADRTLKAEDYEAWQEKRHEEYLRERGLIARRYSDTPLVCDKCGRTATCSTAGGRDGHTMLCPDCFGEKESAKQASMTPRVGAWWEGLGRQPESKTAARADLPLAPKGEAHTAADDYPELGDLLWERPDLIATIPADINRVSLGVRTAAVGDPVPMSFEHTLQDKEQPWWWRKVVGPALQRATDQLPEEYQTDDVGRTPSFDWCRFRRDNHCWFPKELDEEGTRQAGYAVWIPEDRGVCRRFTHPKQKECPIGEPGPDSGERVYGPDGTRSWWEGGQRYTVRRGSLGDNGVPVERRVKTAARWKREAPGFYTADTSKGHYEINRVTLDDGDWWIVEYPGGVISDTAFTLAEARAWAEADINDGEANDSFPVEASAPQCSCMTERDPLDPDGPERVLIHSLSCPLHPDYEPPTPKTGAWKDVRDKGVRIRRDGGVRIISNTGTTVTAEVRGDNDIYLTSITRVPGTKQTAMWFCACDWNKYAWARSAPWKHLEGRQCSHSLALLYEMQSQEMFGGTITEMAQEPDWRTSEPRQDRREGEEPIDYGVQTLDLTSVLDKGAALLALGNIRDSLLVAEADGQLDPESRQRVASMLGSFDEAENHLRSIAFAAQVDGRTTDVVALWPNGDVELSGGRTVPTQKVKYPTYDPSIGLAASRHTAVGYDYWFQEGLRDWNNQRRYNAPKMFGEEGRQAYDDGWSWGMALDTGEVDPYIQGKHHVAARRGVMVALSPSREVCEQLSALAAEAGFEAEVPEQIHLTLAYCGNVETDSIDKDAFLSAVRAFAAQVSFFQGSINGLGTFLNGDEGVLWAAADIGGLAAARTSLVEMLNVAGVPPRTDHDFCPHITLAYKDGAIDKLPDISKIAGTSLLFTTVVAAYGGEWTHFDLVGSSGETTAVETIEDGLTLAASLTGKATSKVAAVGWEQIEEGVWTWRPSEAESPISMSILVDTATVSPTSFTGDAAKRLFPSGRRFVWQQMPSALFSAGIKSVKVDIQSGESDSFEQAKVDASTPTRALQKAWEKQRSNMAEYNTRMKGFTGFIEAGAYDPRRQCPACGGSGSLAPSMVCVLCDGKGYLPHSDPIFVRMDHRRRQQLPVVASKTAVDAELFEEIADAQDEIEFEFAGLIIKALDTGRVLMTQRTPYYDDDPDEVRGRWEFPGGHLEPGETTIEGAIREFQEETGLSLPDGFEARDYVTNDKYMGLVIVVPNEAWTTSAELLINETMGIGWFELDQVPEIARVEVTEGDCLDIVAEALVVASPTEELRQSEGRYITIDEARAAYHEAYGDRDPVEVMREVVAEQEAILAQSLIIDPDETSGTLEDEVPGSEAIEPEAILHDEPQPALPEVYGAESEGDPNRRPFVPGDPRLAHLADGAGNGTQDNSDLAAIAAAFLQGPEMHKQALKTFSPAEQAALINEGADAHVGASNTDRLDLTGTFYEQADDDAMFY